METYDSSLAPRFSQLLAQRETELRNILNPIGEMAGDGGEGEQHDVVDFKDMATEQSMAVVDEAQADHAALELEQVLAARRRLDGQSYGHCLECGEAIDLRRLSALPSTPYCMACQAIREQARPPATRG